MHTEPTRKMMPCDVPDPLARVLLPQDPKQWVNWYISQNLTDRWGDVNFHNADNKPLGLLERDSKLLESLRAQMWGEMTFIVRKDGCFGILFEVEFCSLESEEHTKDDAPDWYAGLKPHAKVIQALLSGMKNLTSRFPGVQFAVPEEKNIIHDRPAAWAFVADGLLNDKERESLGKAMLEL